MTIVEIVVGLILFAGAIRFIAPDTGALPDLDHKIYRKFERGSFWRDAFNHRSAITHSALIVILVRLVTTPLGNPICFLATLGAAVGLSIHLWNDIPSTNHKFANIRLGRRILRMWESRIWIVLNIFGSIAIAFHALW